MQYQGLLAIDDQGENHYVEGELLTEREIAVLMRADAPIGASKLLLDMKQSGGLFEFFTIPTTVKEIMVSDEEFQKGLGYLMFHKIVRIDSYETCSSGKRNYIAVLVHGMAEPVEEVEEEVEKEVERDGKKND